MTYQVTGKSGIPHRIEAPMPDNDTALKMWKGEALPTPECRATLTVVVNFFTPDTAVPAYACKRCFPDGYQYKAPEQDTRMCLYCGHSGPSAEFVSFNPSQAGNLACKNGTDCARRQAEAAGLDDRLRAMAAQTHDESGPDGVSYLAEAIETGLGQDAATSILLAGAYWEITS